MEIKKSNFDTIKKRFVELVGEDTFNKECSFALQHLQKNPYLQKSTPESLLSAVLNIAQVGLTLNPIMKLAYLVPRYVGGQVTCCLEPSYQGLVKLLTDSGSVTNVYAHLIYSNDKFEQRLGTENEILHIPKLGNSIDMGSVIGVYAVGVLKGGGKQTEVMPTHEIDAIRDSSESYKAFKSGKAKSCIWNDWYEEMARKTVIKRLAKYLPKSGHEKLMKAIDLDNDDYQMSDGQANFIDSLLLTSSISEEKKEHIEEFMCTFSHAQAQQTIELLKESQIDPITHGGGGGQKAIIESTGRL